MNERILGSQLVGTALCGLAEKCPTLCFVSEPVLVLSSLRVVLCLGTKVGLVDRIVRTRARLHDVNTRRIRCWFASLFQPAVGSQVGRDEWCVDGLNGRG